MVQDLLFLIFCFLEILSSKGWIILLVFTQLIILIISIIFDFKILGLEPDFYKNESKAGIFQKNQEALWELSYITEFNNLFLTHDFLECLAKKLIT